MKIRILKNGPYEVTPDIPLAQAEIAIDDQGISQHWQAGKRYTLKSETYYLCRCGHSKNKPFCDNTHSSIGFDGTETARLGGYDEHARIYRGETLFMMDDESLCASLRFCDRGPRAWTAAIKSDNPQYRRIAIEEANNCASGRLTAVDRETGERFEPELPKEISPTEDTAAGFMGPLWVKGGIPLESADGQPYEIRNRMTLCRCGASENKPFCDTRHLSCEHMRGHD